MTLGILPGRLACLIILLSTVTGCFQPPFDRFRSNMQPTRPGVKTGFEAAPGKMSYIGYRRTRPQLIEDLYKNDIQFVSYGHTQTLIVPTDKYFYFDSPRINELAYCGLNKIAAFLKYYANTPIYVAGFTDDVGSRQHKRKLSQSQAEAMVTFLWAKGIVAQRLRPAGYADKHPIGDNNFIRGSAYNRRLEIQWMSAPSKQSPPKISLGLSKFGLGK